MSFILYVVVDGRIYGRVFSDISHRSAVVFLPLKFGARWTAFVSRVFIPTHVSLNYEYCQCRYFGTTSLHYEEQSNHTSGTPYGIQP